MGLIGKLRGTSWPQLGNVHKNGDRVVGRESPRAADLYVAGTPPMWALKRTSVDAAVVSGVRVDDRHPIVFDGQHWWCEVDGRRAGRLNWTLADETRGHLGLAMPLSYPRVGALTVTRLVLSAKGDVVNFGGIVYPA